MTSCQRQANRSVLGHVQSLNSFWLFAVPHASSSSSSLTTGFHVPTSVQLCVRHVRIHPTLFGQAHQSTGLCDGAESALRPALLREVCKLLPCNPLIQQAMIKAITFLSLADKLKRIDINHEFMALMKRLGLSKREILHFVPS